MAKPRWADGPWSLIETPSKTKDMSQHGAIFIANEMACTHNCIIRGMNSIYLQAEYVQKPEDIADFLIFVRSWASWVSDHHILEEGTMFPGFEEVARTPGLLGDNVEQHHAFQPQLKTLLAYSTDTKPDKYVAETIRKTIEEMAPSFHQHLSDEINSLLSLQSYNGQALLKVYKRAVAEATKQDKHAVPPLVLGLRDVTYEGGSRWPALPPLSEWIVHYVFGRRYSGAWRFLPCDTWGKPRALAFGPKSEEGTTV
ncbi:hypothetical protein N7448_010737 [Penicillium atrosanguineum]|uniref:Hemerythrin-like domain-containing protein n=1 Tax=Penicillium atrosanguineum TaxID=1132637 RepID=A0A9W9KUH9_9EURO|nr:oxidoreductase [Penicillium atrosanguineum]KAJ5119028.1 hypothetical protein N7526_010665 [Penicillium atrosanguineum]KAJ5120068.1 hypothetical protein N7448_010737 [Penicillium atrosanguineum]KAJ5297066.1 oxidoreductase [Penicillium atrosanguineum]KAJ5299825.1 hypothetical protein N7476_011382 [Penicillium atrosanguineum]